jgi:hypothetical protein
MVQESSPLENAINVQQVAPRISKGQKSLDSKGFQLLEEEYQQWTSLKQNKSAVFESHHSDVQENDEGTWANGPPKGEFVTLHTEDTLIQPSSNPPRLESSNLVTHSKTIPIEGTCYNEDFSQLVNRSIVTRSNSKCVAEIPRLEIRKVKEIALQAKLEVGAYVCQECQIAVATSRGEIGFHKRYPCLLFFCIFLNVMSILSFLFCISVLRTMFPNPAY